MLEFTVNRITADLKTKKFHYYRKHSLCRLCCSWEGANRHSISFSPVSAGSRAAAQHPAQGTQHLAGGSPDKQGLSSAPRYRCQCLPAFFSLWSCSLHLSSLLALGEKMEGLYPLWALWVLPPHFCLTDVVSFNLLKKKEFFYQWITSSTEQPFLISPFRLKPGSESLWKICKVVLTEGRYLWVSQMGLGCCCPPQTLNATVSLACVLPVREPCHGCSFGRQGH